MDCRVVNKEYERVAWPGDEINKAISNMRHMRIDPPHHLFFRHLSSFEWNLKVECRMKKVINIVHKEKKWKRKHCWPSEEKLWKNSRESLQLGWLSAHELRLRIVSQAEGPSSSLSWNSHTLAEKLEKRRRLAFRTYLVLSVSGMAKG